MKWIITKDLLHTDGKHSRVGYGSFGVDKNLHTRVSLALSPMTALALPHQFRLKDDDGEIYYEGRSDDNTSQDAFRPLDWAEADAGCTIIEYRNHDQWEML
jgi:hypothetical protein